MNPGLAPGARQGRLAVLPPLLLVTLPLAIPLPLSDAAAQQDREIVLATTTSVRDAGLLELLVDRFEASSPYTVKVIAVGSGQAMELGRRGEADILILHEPRGEAEFVRQGYGVRRDALMHNEFVIVGPPDDPAAIRGSSPIAALRGVADHNALFVSRADRSGTHTKERALWLAAGVEPERSWYRESGQGMSVTLQIANELGAYALSDIGTLLSHRSPLDLEILVEGDSALHNPYHIVTVNAARFPWTNTEGTEALRAYLLAPETQRLIGEFRRSELGRSLFQPAQTTQGRTYGRTGSAEGQAVTALLG